ncbi:hypothetical protein [Sporichthya polymorpha]|uniref:hypothetical protein n=1 Tax=Sporichthya polymorpha TaxID=35751 RepID=UPI00035FD098|nr:hypothetical protein [Sporichthya polymorpha]
MTAPVAGADAIPAPAATPEPEATANRAADRAADRAAEIADTTAKIALYARVSRIAAAERDPRVAVGAAWATDVLTVQQLLAERAPAESDAAHQRFLAVATAVGAAVAGANEAEPAKARDAREVVVAARRRMLGVFDASAAALIAERLTDLEHLAELPPAVGKALPSPGDALQWRAREIGPAGLIEALHVAASDGRLIAAALLAAGYRRDAARQMCLADVAEVEAYLVEASVAVGDDALLLADVRRGALVFLLSEAAERPVDVAAARAGVWAAVRAALPPAEVERLAPRLGRTRTAA